MEIRQFTYVDMVAQCGSFTKAAQKLFISQPALSNYISKVEEEMGVKLFDRSASRLVVTYAGEQYLKRAKSILGQLADMEREMRDITHHMKGNIKLGFPNERIIYMLPLILAPFKEQYPGITVEVVTGAGNRLVGDLRAGDIDFVFLPSWNTYRDIVQEEIAQEELLLVARKGYLAEELFLDRERNIIDWRKASRLPAIVLKKGHAIRSSTDVLYRNAGVAPDIVFESHSNMLSCRLAAQGMGVAVVPEITLELLRGGIEAEVCHLSEHPVTWSVNVLYRENAYVGEAERTLFRLAREAISAHNKKL
ncbi:MAG: LysR family transcriptional regulator [Eubacteriales bacterium]|nr:LysR family transcriptional regulator [Eubacteriales bacterium]